MEIIKEFKSEITNRTIQIIDQCFYCKNLRACDWIRLNPPFKCPEFNEDPEVRVGGVLREYTEDMNL